MINKYYLISLSVFILIYVIIGCCSFIPNNSTIINSNLAGTSIVLSILSSIFFCLIILKFDNSKNKKLFSLKSTEQKQSFDFKQIDLPGIKYLTTKYIQHDHMIQYDKDGKLVIVNFDKNNKKKVILSALEQKFLKKYENYNLARHQTVRI